MFWDKVAGIYDVFADLYNAKAHERLCRQVEEMISEEDEILECACGTGMLTLRLAPRCRSIIATDLSSKMLQKAQEKCRNYPNVRFECSDMCLDYKDGSFDKVIAANVIHLLDRPYEALGELDRVCRRGGRLIIPTYVSLKAGGDQGVFSKMIGKAGASFKRQFSYELYRKFFEDAGYEEVSFFLAEGRVPCAIAVIVKV
ncbi:MAG: class I SAM-dependent methyltransferase [Filifactor alocis]|nr:class I SAM-dependent methyltransferase [Filifactor alocis]